MDLSDSEGLSLERLSRGLQALQSDLSLPQLLALLRIAVEPGLSVNELGERLGASQQTASRHVAALLGRYQGPSETGGDASRSKLDPLILQEVSQMDPRRRALYVSSQGRAVLKKLVSTISGGKQK